MLLRLYRMESSKYIHTDVLPNDSETRLQTFIFAR